jgi:putative transcriptional regulator
LPVKKAFHAQRCLPAALLVMLLLPGPSQSLAADGTPATAAPPSTQAPRNTLTSILLVAQGAVSDPNFGGSIVVVMNNLGPGPIGIIINRPMPLPVSRFFPKLKRLAQMRAKVYYGGPVEFGSLWYLFRAKTAPAPAIRVCDGVYVGSDEKLLLKLLSRPDPMQGLRLFIGHAGWYPGQLQMEIQGGAWRPGRADADSIFNPQPQLPWPSRPGPKSGT